MELSRAITALNIIGNTKVDSTRRIRILDLTALDASRISPPTSLDDFDMYVQKVYIASYIYQ